MEPSQRDKQHPRRIPEDRLEFLARILPFTYKPFLQNPPPDLTHQQLKVLCLLDAVKPWCITVLAGRLGLKKSATSIMVSRLERRGLVWKERWEKDRRVVFVRLTPTGERMRSAPSAVDPRKLEARLMEFTRREGRMFVALVKRLVSLLTVGYEDGWRAAIQLFDRPRLRLPEMAREPC